MSRSRVGSFAAAAFVVCSVGLVVFAADKLHKNSTGSGIPGPAQTSTIDNQPAVSFDVFSGDKATVYTADTSDTNQGSIDFEASLDVRCKQVPYTEATGYADLKILDYNTSEDDRYDVTFGDPNVPPNETTNEEGASIYDSKGVTNLPAVQPWIGKFVADNHINLQSLCGADDSRDDALGQTIVKSLYTAYIKNLSSRPAIN